MDIYIDKEFFATAKQANESLHTILRTHIAFESNKTSFNLTNLNLEEIPELLKRFEELKFLFLGTKHLDTHLNIIVSNDTGLQNRIRIFPIFLNQLKKLERLYLDNNQISNFNDIYLPNLKYLDISGNKFQNLDSLKGLKNLEFLDIKNNNLDDITGITYFPKLKFIDFSNNTVIKIPENIPDHCTMIFSNNPVNRDLKTNVITKSNKILVRGIKESLNIINTKNKYRIDSLERIKDSFINKTKILDLTGLFLTSIPAEIKNLAHLETLILDNNKITDFSNLRHLPNLSSLSIFSNGIEKLNNMDVIQRMKHLNLSGNNLSDEKYLEKLINVETLNISDNKFANINILSSFNYIQSLDISNNYLKELHLSDLRHLKILNIIGAEIDNACLSNLPSLEKIKTGLNTINSIEISNLNKIQSLNLSSSYLKTIRIKRLIELQDLNLYNNSISEQFIISKVPNLRKVNLSKNQIHSIGPIIDMINENDNLNWMCLTMNPIDDIENALIDKYNCIDSLKGYARSLRKGKVLNNSYKLVLVGNSTSGKSTLRNLLFSNKIFDDEVSTHGIINCNWITNIDNKDYNISIWDFGGQEYYHSTYSLFFSHNATFVLLWERKTNRNGYIITSIKPYGSLSLENVRINHFHYEYWLKYIRKYGGDSKILLMKKKIDFKDIKEITSTILSDFNVQSQNVLKVSLLESIGDFADYKDEYSNFKERLLRTIKESSKFSFIGENWVLIKQIIEQTKISSKYISFKRFKELCKEVDKTIDDLEFDSLVDFLCSTSIILYYKAIPCLKEIVFIDPVWLCNKIYEVLNIDVLNNKGEFTLDEAEKFLSGDINLAHQIIGIMLNFNLIFNAPYDPNIYIAPQYLPDDFEEYAPKHRNSIRNQINTLNAISYVLKYENYFDRLIMRRLIVEFGMMTTDLTFWKNGIIFSRDNISVYIFNDTYANKIYLYSLKGNEKSNLVINVFHFLRKIDSQNRNLLISMNDIDFVKAYNLEREIHNSEYMMADTLNVVRTTIFKFLFKKDTLDTVRINIYFSEKDKHLFEQFNSAFNNVIDYVQNAKFYIISNIFNRIEFQNIKSVLGSKDNNNVVVLLLSDNFVEIIKNEGIIEEIFCLDSNLVIPLALKKFKIEDSFNSAQCEFFRSIKESNILNNYSFEELIGRDAYFPFINEYFSFLLRKVELSFNKDIIRNNERKFSHLVESNNSIFIGVVIALEEEFKTFIEIFSNYYVVKKEELFYYVINYGIINTKQIYLIVTCLFDMGHNAAVLATEKLINSFHPQLIVSVGIAAGINDDIRIGDILVADVVDNFMDKSSATDNGENQQYAFNHGGEPYRTDGFINNVIINLKYASTEEFKNWQIVCLDFLKKNIDSVNISFLIDNDLIRPEISILKGHIASSSTLIKSKYFIEWLKSKDRKFMGAEMESGGVLFTANSSLKKISTIVIRGISDFGDSRKEQLDSIEKGGLRKYAMYNAVTFLRQFLSDFL